MTDSKFTFWACLSYSQLDNQPQRPGEPGGFLNWGDWWHTALETSPVPAEFIGQTNSHGEIIPGRIDPVYRVTAGSSNDDALDAEQRKALEQSRYLVVICSPRSARSARVNETVRYFKQLGRGSRILPIVVAGEPYASGGQKPGLSPEAECFVPAMRHPVNPDGTLNTSRVERGYNFADARQGRDRQEILAADFSLAEPGLEIARIQLLAGLIGVGFNGLLRREQSRRFAGFATAQQEARTAQSQAQSAREQARAAQDQLELFQLQAQETSSQLEAARHEVREAQKRMLESQNLPPDVQSQIADTQNKFLEAERRTHDAQKKVLELEHQARQLEKQVTATQGETREVQGRFEMAQERANAAEQLVQALQNQTRDARQQLQSAQDRATAAENEARKVETRPVIQADPNLPVARTSKRLLQVFAVLAALALFAAGMTANYAAKQRQRADQAADQAAAVTAGKFDLAQDGLDDEHIRQALQKFGGTEQSTNRFQSLDALAGQIPVEAISNTLGSASVIVDDRQRVHFQDRLLDAWVNTNAPATFNWACDQTNTDLRERAFSKVIPILPAGQFTNTLDRLNELKLPPGDQNYTLLLQRWATNAPEQAMDWANSQTDLMAKNQALAAVINGLATTDFSNALAQAASLPAGDARSHIVAGLFQNQAATNALTFVPVLPAADQVSATNQIMTFWAQNDPSAAAQFAGEHPELPVRLYREIALAWGKSDFSAATNWFAGLPSDDEKAAALSGLALAQSTNAPEPALDWLQSSPETNAQPAIQDILKSWSQTEPEAAARWLADLPPATNNDSLFNSFITGAVVKYPDFAAQWTQSLTNDAERQKLQIQVARQWLKTDPTAATNWIDGLNLPAKIRSTLKALAQ